MVHYHRGYQLMKKEDNGDGDEDYTYSNNNNHVNITKPKFLYLLFLSFISFSFILAKTTLHRFSSSLPLVCNSIRFDDETPSFKEASIHSIVFNGTIFCDRSLVRSDVCTMAGDVRTHSLSSSIIVFGTTFTGNPDDTDGGVIQREKVRPYTRKREKSIMSTIDELNLVVKIRTSSAGHRCDVRHDVPGLFFSTGGYTGNFFHDFTDGIVPLFITSNSFKGRVVFVILEYHRWWVTKYDEILSHLSDYQVIDFRRDNRTHCFPGAVVGLRAHEDLQIDPSLTENNMTIQDFRDFLDRAYSTRIREIVEEEEELEPPLPAAEERKKPRLVVMARNDSRMILNQKKTIELAREIGFRVEVLVPDRRTELARMYRILNASDAMVGVHGAALTHFMFLRPGSVFIQIVPVGIDWAAENYCEKPAVRMGLKYIGYKIAANESTLHKKYAESDVVFTNPLSVNRKGWNYTKGVYLDHQNVVLNLPRFRPSLLRAYDYLNRFLNG